MMDLILTVAKDNDLVRAVVMFGSRANPMEVKDRYQDFDIYYIVNDLGPFRSDPNWVSCFGTNALLYMPADMTIPEPLDDGTAAYLMLFPDGNRIDLCVCTLAVLEEKMNIREKGQPLVGLLDKDGVLPAFEEPSDHAYHIRRPTEKNYSDVCMGLFWEMQNVAKGIMRDELPYSMFLLNVAVRPMLDCMIDWHIGIHTDFAVSVGKLGKHYRRYLSSDHYEQYKKTYPDSSYTNMWNSLLVIIELFRELAVEVGSALSFRYPVDAERSIVSYLEGIRE